MGTQWPIEHDTGHQGTKSLGEGNRTESNECIMCSRWVHSRGGNVWFYMEIKKILQREDLGEPGSDILIGFMVFSVFEIYIA